MQNKQRQSLARSQKEAAAQGLEIGPLIATINIPAGYAAEGEFLGGININQETGEVEILDRRSSTAT